MTRFNLTLLGALLVAACSDSRQASDRNTNWLRECSSSSHCDEGASCLCGVCTAACVEDSACERADGPAAVCTSIEAGECGDVERGAVCFQSCTRDAQCDGDLACVAGSCQRVAGPPSGAIADASAAEGASTVSGSDGGPVFPRQEFCFEYQPCLMPGALAGLVNVVDIKLTRDSLYVVDRGTMDDLGNAGADGAIYSVPLEPGEAEPLITGRTSPWLVLVDEDQLFWQEGGVVSEIWTAQRADGANPTRLASDAFGGAWSQDAAHLYYLGAPDAARVSDLFRVSKDMAEIELLASGFESGSTVLVDSQRVYVGGAFGFRTVPLSGGEVVALQGAPGGVSGGALDETSIFYAHGAGEELEVMSKQGGTGRVLARGTTATYELFQILPYRDYVYFAVTVTEVGDLLQVMRAPLARQESASGIMYVPPGLWQQPVFTIGDTGFFWMQEGELHHMGIIELELADPRQGARGAPCFEDLTCDGSFTCVDTVCR